MWNITVRSSAGVDKPGRVYVDYLAEYTGGNGAAYQLYSTMYAATTDGYVYQVDTNGLDPQGFIFYGNRVGFYDPDGKTPLYHDVNYPSNDLKSPDGGVIIAPASAKIFFTNPLNSDLPVSLLPTPVTPNINNVTFVGTASGVNGYYSQGGVFKYTGNVGGISEIIIQGPGQTDFKADNTKNRRLLSEAVTGSNSITWDGKDNTGDYFPVGTNYAYKVILHAGEYHFPMIDSENSVYGGPSITMLNPVGGVCPFGNCRTGFYDDRVYKVSTGTIVPTGYTVGNTLPGDDNSLNPPTVNHSDLTTGYDTSTTQRAYGYATEAQAGSADKLKKGFGNWKALDLWAFYPVEAVQSTLNVVAQANSDLRITKMHSGSFSVGGTGTFTITVSNVGTNEINGNKTTTVTDTLPSGLTLAAKPIGTGWTCTGTAGSSSFTCTRKEKINTGSSFPTITYTVNIGSTSSASVINTAVLTNDNDANSGNNTATDIVTIASPELTITKSDNISQQATVGISFNWTINVQNQGTAAANFTAGQNILTDTLPTGPTYGTPSISSATNISNSANIQCSISGNTLSCIANGATVSFLGSSGSLTVAIPVTPVTATSLSNTATVDPNNVVTESNETNNASTDVVTVAGSDIAITKTVSPTTAILENGTLTYTVTATNNGPRAATAVVITDLLPTGLTFLTGVPSQGTYNSSTGVWTVGALANGTSATLTITATVNSGIGGATITNTASRTSSNPLDSNTTNDSASATTSVVSIDAVNDDGFAVNGTTGGTTLANVLINDKLNGTTADISKVNLTQESTTNSGVTLDTATGKINVAAGTASGSYTVTYQICDKSNSTFCDKATVTVPVVVIDAKNDEGEAINGTIGGESLADVLANDTLNGAPAKLSDVVLSQQNTTNPGVTLDETTGKVNIAAGTPAGSYTVTYQICDKSNPTFCDTATVRVPVVVIDAVNDPGSPVNGSVGGQSLADVLANDTLNGNSITLSDVTLKQEKTTNANVTLNETTGQVNVAAGTPAGNYTVTYQICDKSHTTFCDTANVTVPVVVIDAIDDSGAVVNGVVGGQSLADVLVNDTLNGVKATLSNVVLSQVGTTNSGVNLDPTTGEVNVAAGTASGNYVVTYKICDKSNSAICDTAMVTVPVVVIDAVNDSGLSVNGVVGGQSLANVLVNDTLNGSPVTLPNVNLTQVSTTGSGITLDTTTGKVNVAAGTAAGNYTVTYQICDKSNPSFCDSADVTVPVVVIDATNDTGSTINGKVGGESLANVLANDTLNGSPVSLSNVNLTQEGTTNPGVTLDEITGKVNVTAGTPAGNYTVTYKICDKSNPTFCDTAEVTVPVVLINAVDDSGASVNGLVGGESLADVLTNDTLNGNPVSLSGVNLTQESTTNAGVTLDPTTGKVNVAVGTPAGSYTLTYKICDKSNPTFCDNADVVVPVTAAVINASDDTATTVNGTDGATSLLNVLTNDTLNGSPVDPTKVNLTETVADPTGALTLNPDGSVNVAAGTPAGSYSLTYQICEILNPTNCDTATVTVPVVVIDATDDTGASVNGFVGGESLADVLANDTLNGNPVTLSDVNLTQVSTTNSGVTLDETTGKVNVAAGTPAGSYSVTYQICDKSNPTFCDTATVTVPVTAPVINAVDDDRTSSPVLSTAGGNPGNAFANDTLNGLAIDPTLISASIITPASNPGVSLNTTNGDIHVNSGTPSGTYTIDYKICEILNPANCDTATITVLVVSIDAVNDTGNSVNGLIGGESLANVLTNDSVNGTAAVIANVDLTQVSTTHSGVTLDEATGKVNVAPGTPAGNYTVTYKICDKSNPTYCDSADVAVPVTAATILANDDTSANVNGTDGATDLINVLTNDTLNGAGVDPTKVNLTETVADPTGALTLNPDGSVDVTAGTPAGSYSLTYQICEKLNPTNCDTATVSVPVVVIDAADDTGASVNGFVGGESLANVLANDTLNGNPASLSIVNLTQVSTTNSGVTLDETTGKVNVAAGTPAGDYTVTYQICDKSNPTFCDSAVVSVSVTAAVIDANDDLSVAVNGTDGATGLLNVLDNDTLNGSPVDPVKITLTETVADPSGALTLNPDGSVDVAADTPAGSYSLTYQICEKLNPTNCDTATVTVPVVVIDAADDSGASVNGFVGGESLANVLTNDTLNGSPVTLSDVNLTQESTTNPGVTLDETTGKVNVAVGTPAGSYTVTYQICDKINPSFCDTADVTVPVAAALIDAKDDTSASINGTDGATNLINVLTNDTLNGTVVDPTKVTLTETVADPSGALTLNPDGSVDVAAGTPAGNYTLTYQICEKLNPTNCDTATVTVPVVVIDALNDSGATVVGSIGGQSLANVLANDTLNGSATSLSAVNLSQVSTSDSHVTLDETTGEVIVAPGTPAGSYTVTYKICDKSNPTFCDTADVSVPVTAALIDAKDDTSTTINGADGATNVINVLSNDTLNGTGIDLTKVTLTETVADPSGALTLNPDGSVDVASGTSAGDYTLTYQICEKLNPTNCDTATATVPVVVIDANNDNGATINGTIGGESLADVLTNDTLNGNPASLSDVDLTQLSTTNSGVTLDETSGKVNVAAGTPSGSYTVTYQICDKINSTFCDTATVNVPVVVINAANDTGNSVNGFVGGESLANVLVNDTLNGSAVNLSDVILSQTNTTNAGVTLDEATGKVNVAAGTPAGTYTVTYQICDKSNPTFCDTADVTVPVTAAEIVANDDTSATVNGTDGATNVLNVLTNDTLNGALVDPAKVTLSQTVADPSGALTLGPDGSIDVAAGTPAGSYNLTYQICETLNPANCDTAVVTVPVAVIDATNDTGSTVNGFVGGESLADVLANDTLNGSPASLSDVNLSQLSTTNSGVTLDETTGEVDVAAGTPAGSYIVTYQICDKSNPTFCDSADVSVLVSTPAINAVDDSSSAVNGTVGDSNVLNVFDNDTLNGEAVEPTKVTLTTTIADPTGALALNADGSVSVAAGTSGGTYSLTYQICEKLNPTNCDTAVVTVPVVVIDAVDDSGNSVNGKAGGISESNVLANDTLNGITASLGTVSLEQISSSNPNVSLNIGTAEVVVAPGTASGNYTLTYKICDLLNPDFCDEAEVTVPVTSSTILAVDDDYTSSPIAGKTGGDAGNALVNDTMDGVIVNIADIDVSVVTPSDDPGVTLDTATGLVSVAAGTSGGEHTIDYRICEKLNPSNCSDATIKVLVNTYDLGLTMTLKTGQPDVVKAGDNATYTITVKNSGNLTSGNPIVITDTIPTGMTLDDPNWTIGSGNTAVYTLTSDLTEAGSSTDTISIEIKLKVDSGYAGGSLSNFVEITTDQGDDVDSTPANGAQTPAEDDEASVDITAHNYGLGIAKTATESSFAIVGDLIHYSYVVTNGGDVDQNNVVVTDDKIDDDSANIDCDDTGSNVISVLKPGAANAVICIATYVITEADVTAGLVTNTASVVSDETTTPVTTELTVPGLFDPITGIKVYDASKLPILTWTMTWINSSNDLPVAGHVSDPIPLGSTIHSVGAPSGYAVPSDAPAGSSNLGVSCTTPAGSTTTTSLCYYRGPETGFPTGQIVWEGVIGGDKGHIDTKTSKNQIVISFSTNIPDGTTVSANVAEMSSDLNSDGDYDDPGEENSASAISTWTEHSESATAASVAGLPLPITGFAPNIETPLLAQPFNLQYESLAANGLSIDIPSLGLKGLQIVGVPQTSNGWNVQWLDKNIGYLDGTAFPTWKGNSVLTGHVYLSNGLPGPFVNLSKLKYGDKVILHAWGQTYTYEVRETETIDPSDSKEVLKHEDLSWITLLTCKDYDEKSKVYLSRFLARAVLISVK